MDFIVGILLMIIIIFILINFASVNISDSSNKDLQNQIPNQTQIPNQNQTILQNTNIPEPLVSGAPSALNNKLNLEVQTYDYNKYFFM